MSESYGTPEIQFAVKIARHFPEQYLVILLDNWCGEGLDLPPGAHDSILALPTPADESSASHCSGATPDLCTYDASIESCHVAREGLAASLATAGLPRCSTSTKDIGVGGLPCESTCRDRTHVMATSPWQIAMSTSKNLQASRLHQDSRYAPERLRLLTAGKSAVLVPCTFDTQEQIHIAQQLLPHVVQNSASCVLIVQLLPRGVTPGPDTNPMLLKRHEMMLAIGQGPVLTNPPADVQHLHQAIEYQCGVYKQCARRMKVVLDAEMVEVNQAQLHGVTEKKDRLLWMDIPSVILPQLPALERSISESPTHIGTYSFVRRLGAREGYVFESVERNAGESFAIKIVDKACVVSPQELECLYREYVILSQTITHPNIVKCHKLIHSKTKLYFVLDFAGPKNLEQLLEDKTHHRLPPAEAEELFRQGCAGVAYCHLRNVYLRGISLQHFVIKETCSGVQWTIVDFYSACVVRGDGRSSVQFGGMPCIAPEIIAGESYKPRLADCWAMGIVHLESAAGLGVLDAAVEWVGAALERGTADRILRFFSMEGAHERLFRLKGAQGDPLAISKLRALLQVTPEARARLSEFAPPMHSTGTPRGLS